MEVIVGSIFSASASSFIHMVFHSSPIRYISCSDYCFSFYFTRFSGDFHHRQHMVFHAITIKFNARTAAALQAISASIIVDN